MKIALQNKTHWRDDHIRAFLVRGIKEERPDLCKRGALPMHVTITYTRGSSQTSSGYAYYHSRTMRVRLPKHGNPDKVDLALVIAHELAHTRGLKHDMMNSCATYGRVNGYRELYAWAYSLPLEQKVVKSTKATPDKKLAHAEKMLKTATTREKRATTLRKKWETKVKYYTRRLKGEI